MPHIIILDENGNEIGREEHDPGGGGRIADDDEPTIVRMNLALVGDLLKGGNKEEKEDEST